MCIEKFINIAATFNDSKKCEKLPVTRYFSKVLWFRKKYQNELQKKSLQKVDSINPLETKEKCIVESN
jgi:hypothetical protein